METDGFVIAAVSSGSGKTTVANGLLRGLRRQGYKVAPFKVGPDYIDTHYHKIASGRDSINLDIFMSSEEHVGGLYKKYTEGCDIAIIEGVMGLFDGYDREMGSAAHIAKLLDLPVVLLINSASSAYSLAAVLTGFRVFDPKVKIAGVIFNNVASDNHLRLLVKAAEDSGIKCLGHISRDRDLTVPCRHLGLSLEDDDIINCFIDKAANAVEKGVNLEDLVYEIQKLNCTHGSGNKTTIVTYEETGDIADNKNLETGIIAVAHDEAFNFIYPENIQALKFLRLFKGRRMRIVEFSPLRDKQIPEAEFVYLPGGYPELYKERLSAHVSMRESVKRFVEDGGYALAECGGMLYLGDDIDGWDMCGVFPLSATMDGARLHLGYRTVKFKDFELRGHEFHYSRVEEKCAIPSIAKQTDVRGDEITTPVYRYKNCIAGYTHFYWADKNISDIYI